MTKGLIRSLRRGPQQQQILQKLIYRVEDLEVTVSATGVANGIGSAVIGDLPEGNIAFLGGVGYFELAGSGSDANLVDTWSGDFAVGTNPVAGAGIDGLEQNIVNSSAVGPAVAEVAPRARGAGPGASVLDNTDGSLELNLNVLIDAADITDDQSVTLTVNGEIVILFSVLFDD